LWMFASIANSCLQSSGLKDVTSKQCPACTKDFGAIARSIVISPAHTSWLAIGKPLVTAITFPSAQDGNDSIGQLVFLELGNPPTRDRSRGGVSGSGLFCCCGLDWACRTITAICTRFGVWRRIVAIAATTLSRRFFDPQPIAILQPAPRTFTIACEICFAAQPSATASNCACVCRFRSCRIDVGRS